MDHRTRLSAAVDRSIARLSRAWCVWLAAFAWVCAASAQDFQGVSSTEAQPWEKISGVSVAKAAADRPADIEIQRDEKLQRIEGFGGCFNELGWEALLALPANTRDEVLRRLFSPEGANFTICRVPIGASDYALSYYTYDDVAEDFALENFNIDRDRYILIPYIKAAKAIRPDLRLWGSPWSPPAWMKVNEHYAMSPGPANSPSSKLPPGKKIANNATAFKLQHAYLEAYALYFSKYVQAYAKEGLEIGQIHVQNEIVYQPYWPSCTWRPEDLAYFIGKYLGPRFKQDNLSTEIWLGTVNTGDPGYIRTVLGNQEAAAHIKGLGVQWDAKKCIDTIHREFPTYPIMQTESECGNGEKNWKAAEHTWSLMQRYLSNGAGAYMYWNMVLDSTGRSTWGWKQNTLIAIDRQTKQVVYTPEFYLMMHLSHFVPPGAQRVKTVGGNDHLAFVNPDGTVVLLLANVTDAAKPLRIRMGDVQCELVAKPRSFVTLTWR